MKKAKLDLRSCPKWKRDESKAICHGQEEDPEKDPKNYDSRILTRPACSGDIETAGIQLFCKQGFQDIYCGIRGHHARSKGMLCQCGLAWHGCDLHRHDPAAHRSKRAPAKEKSGKEIDCNNKDSDRKAPEAVEQRIKQPRPSKCTPRTLFAHSSHANEGPMTTILPAVIDRFRKRLVDHPVHAESDNKKVRVQVDPHESNELRIDRNRRLQMHVHENQDQPDHKRLRLTQPVRARLRGDSKDEQGEVLRLVARS